MSVVQTSVEQRTALVTLNRPDALNALSSELLLALLDALDNLSPRQDLGAVILTGAGDRAFAAGADIREMKDMSPRDARRFASLGQRVTLAIENLPVPVIAAVNGYALGGGCELALACDIRLCSQNAVFGQPEIDLGVIPGWGGTQRLVRLCGSGLARELIYTGKRIDAATALAWGLVNAVYPQGRLMDEARLLAAGICSKSRVAVEHAKAAANRALDQDLAGGLYLEADLFALCFSTSDQKEGMEAFLTKRRPSFKHR